MAAGGGGSLGSEADADPQLLMAVGGGGSGVVAGAGASQLLSPGSRIGVEVSRSRSSLLPVLQNGKQLQQLQPLSSPFSEVDAMEQPADPKVLCSRVSKVLHVK